MKYTILSLENEEKLAEVEIKPGVRSEVSLGSKSFSVGSQGAGMRESFLYTKGSKAGVVHVATALGSMALVVARGTLDDSSGSAGGSQKSVKSSMPGKVLKVLCKAGDKVEAGQPVLVLEAMKMENEIRAPMAGKLEKISAVVGNKIETGELLFVLVKE